MNEEITSRLVWLGKDSSSPEAEVGNTLSKLPDDVREWALTKLVWFCPRKKIDGQAASIDPVPMERYAEGCPDGDGGFWLNLRVVYVAPHVFGRTQDEFRHIIAHEIAHHWLRHSPGKADDCDAKEEEAEALAHRWLKTLPQEGEHQG